MLQDLRTRKIQQIVSDGHDGLLAAVAALFPATPRQRCLVQKQRNIMNAIPKREQESVTAELAGMRETAHQRASLDRTGCLQRQISPALS